MSSATTCCSIAAAVGCLDGLDCSSLPREDINIALAELARVQSWHDSVHARLTRRLGELAETDTAIFPAADLAGSGHRTRRDADQAVRRAEVLGDVPEMEQALTNGHVSAAHVDALERAVRRLGPDRQTELTGQGDRLSQLASKMSPEQFQRCLHHEISRIDREEGTDRLTRQRRACRLRSWTDRDTGMICLHGEYDPESGIRLIARINHTVEAMFHTAIPDTCPPGDSKHDHLRALALHRLITRRTPTRTQPNPNPTDPNAPNDPDDAGAGFGEPGDIDQLDHNCEIIVTMTLDQLTGATDNTTNLDSGFDIDLPIQTYRRWACTAAIIPTIVDTNRVVLDQGRTTRLATRKQRRALLAMYTTCAIPNCTVTSRHCQPHHIHYWRNGGPTNLANLVPLCSKHHHSVHEGGWHLTIHTDRSLTITHPNGTTQHTGPPSTQWTN